MRASLEKIKGREFAGQDDLERWFAANGITGHQRSLVMQHIPVCEMKAHDAIVCLDAATGKVLWKARFPGQSVGVHGSSTPCVADGRCTFIGSQGNVHCLDARTGDLVWSAKVPSDDRVGSSVLVADGMAVVLAGELVALDARSGRIAWTRKVGPPKAVRGHNGSPALWRKDGKAYVIVSTASRIACFDLGTGTMRWAEAGLRNENTSPTLDGDRMAILGDQVLAGYRLGLDGTERLWTVGHINDHAACPILLGDYVYVVASRTACVEFATGRVVWQNAAQGFVSSPLAADGKIVATSGDELRLFRATPQGYAPLATVRLDLLHCVSPALADGRLYLRLEDSVACYDLRAP